jgi:hypothetical protein
LSDNANRCGKNQAFIGCFAQWRWPFAVPQMSSRYVKFAGYLAHKGRHSQIPALFQPPPAVV